MTDTHDSAAAPLGLDAIVVLSDGVTAAEFDEDLMLVDAAGERCHAAGSTGSRVIALLDPARTVREIVTELCAEYDVAPEACASDVLAFLDAMAAERLVVALS